ncbi:response regulator [Paracoccus sp. S-4012]|uniref:response regulator n=1 Tax=Paracoccus sp. S-4012 TaxID=2665648 RepID=UPI0012AF8295|nr:response regulator [Paracoccus sp. S-4012]MRX52304.1 response regulator [Paracoccus sp. S-4012]
MGPTDYPAKRVLIVEDEVLIAMHLEDMLASLGHEVVAAATRIGNAIELAREGDFDFAILDLNVAGTKSFPVADILRQRGIPFAFATGYGSEGLVDGYRDVPVLEKPYAPHDLERTIARAVRG